MDEDAIVLGHVVGKVASAEYTGDCSGTYTSLLLSIGEEGQVRAFFFSPVADATAPGELTADADTGAIGAIELRVALSGVASPVFLSPGELTVDTDTGATGGIELRLALSGGLALGEGAAVVCTNVAPVVLSVS